MTRIDDGRILLYKFACMPVDLSGRGKCCLNKKSRRSEYNTYYAGYNGARKDHLFKMAHFHGKMARGEKAT